MRARSQKSAVRGQTLVLYVLSVLFVAMIFSEPIPFSEAIQSRDVRSILPTTLSSAEIRDALSQDIIDRAVFSARMSNAEFLQEIDEITRLMVNGEIDLATARIRLTQKLEEIGYQAAVADVGSIKDFTSDKRIDLIIRTNAQIARGYGQFIQGQNEEWLRAAPCQELFRLQRKKQERGTTAGSMGWPQRWQEVGGTLFDGRMIARKDDDVWRRLGTAFPDSLGNPYPPFAFNSGMWVKDVLRSQAVKLGVIAADVVVSPQDKGFNDDLRFTPKIRSEALIQALMESLGPDYQLVDGVLTKA